jgi:hypothetical protein
MIGLPDQPVPYPIDLGHTTGRKLPIASPFATTPRDEIEEASPRRTSCPDRGTARLPTITASDHGKRRDERTLAQSSGERT